MNIQIIIINIFRTDERSDKKNKTLDLDGLHVSGKAFGISIKDNKGLRHKDIKKS